MVPHKNIMEDTFKAQIKEIGETMKDSGEKVKRILAEIAALQEENQALRAENQSLKDEINQAHYLKLRAQFGAQFVCAVVLSLHWRSDGYGYYTPKEIGGKMVTDRLCYPGDRHDRISLHEVVDCYEDSSRRISLNPTQRAKLEEILGGAITYESTGDLRSWASRAMDDVDELGYIKIDRVGLDFLVEHEPDETHKRMYRVMGGFTLDFMENEACKGWKRVT